ncbi:MAG: hypothetical protein HYR84_04905 [Planctomycetes bacterium]|nr:hypothetical protein [Planctomycetota bacterium]
MPADQPTPPTGPPDESRLPAALPKDAANNPIPAGAISAGPMNVPPIPLDPKAAPKPASEPPLSTQKQEPEVKDSFRELIETIVFVVVLVLMLKTFLAEAFVIPTGSMGNTLLGYHHKVTCRQCGWTDTFNASEEAEPKKGRGPIEVVECRCENCGYWNRISHAAAQGGAP